MDSGPYKRLEAVADMEDWPRNVPGKPTRVLVIGVYHPKKGKAFEVLFEGQFPDLEPAMYWAAKKEIHAVRKGKWTMASRVLWQHDITPEQARAAIIKAVTPQLDRAIRGSGDLGPGPMREVGLDENAPKYVEIEDRSGKTLGSFVVPPFEEGPGDGAPPFAPKDPRPPRGNPPG